jgi:hypothetical protein
VWAILFYFIIDFVGLFCILVVGGKFDIFGFFFNFAKKLNLSQN